MRHHLRQRLNAHTREHWPQLTDMHGRCRQTKDVPLPHSKGILLQARCRRSCHRQIAGTP
ncbi:hypothetical protein RB628_08625 [Streptomyces sp. ADMS]|uniref:hypothetical protein n=1 Tax=Streptomyces sp. ADMS TaxID=3071415 RepID=UPI00296E5F64|nr:hypothetical protein [Streptomyces sp. ADMS]MDW4905410.1 hypothetical protein [Streptomyces sp. ADMS]